MITPGSPSARQPLPIHPASQPESFYRMFFLAGIGVILTAGAAWGAVLLWQVARVGSFTEVSIHAINAHGHAQIFGWVGLFIMGFAYQAFPRLLATRLVAPHLALAAFLLMLIGLSLSTVGQWLAESWVLAPAAVIVGGIAQIIAVGFFAGQIICTYLRSAEPLSPAAGFIGMALVWFLAMSVMNLWHASMLVGAESREALLHQIATYQAALRDMQIHGLALFMILGVSMRFFPGVFGLPRTSARRGWIALAILTIAVAGEIVLLIASRLTGQEKLAAMLLVPWVMLAVGIGLIVLPWRLWRPLPQVHRSTKFVRTAYLWLAISLVMLLAFPAYMLLGEMAFSHAYYGAIRHAITVGFVSMMIMGVAAKVVPVLNGIDDRTLSRLWGPFLLVNIGCALRVSTQVMTDWHDVGFALIGFSGVLEVAGIAWWGFGLASIMLFKRRSLPDPATVQRIAASPAGGNAPPLDRGISPATTMRELAAQHPELRPAMARLGLDTCCQGERTAREIAKQWGIEPEAFDAVLRTQATSGARDLASPCARSCPHGEPVR